MESRKKQSKTTGMRYKLKSQEIVRKNKRDSETFSITLSATRL